MNKLEFRIWNIVHNAYDYCDTKFYLIGLDGTLYDGNGYPYDEAHIIEQCSVKRDINSKKIFEGDIVRYEFQGYLYEAEVKIVKGYWTIDTIGYNDMTWPLGMFEVEVIGHIHNSLE